MELTNKIKKILNIGAIAFVGLFGVGLSLVANGVQLKTFEKQYYHQVRADDDSNSISVSADYLLDGLNATYDYEGGATDVNITFNLTSNSTTSDVTCISVSARDSSYYSFEYQEDIGMYVSAHLDTDDNSYYWTLDISGEDNDAVINSITLYETGTYTELWDYFNSPQPQSWLQEIVSLLTGGIVGIAGGVGTGVSTLVGDIFISNNALSTFGGVLVVFAGVSLAIGLCRWVMNFLTSLGAKK